MIISAINGIKNTNSLQTRKSVSKQPKISEQKENNYVNSQGIYGKAQALRNKVSFKTTGLEALVFGVAYVACVSLAVYQTTKIDMQRQEEERRIREENERITEEIRNRYKISTEEAEKFYENFIKVAQIPPTNDGNEIGLNAVQGYEFEKYKLCMDLISPIVSKMKNIPQKHHDKIPNGVLLYGPPGSGKTYLARQVSEHLEYFGANVINIKMSENHVKNVRAIESAFETGYYNYQKTGKYTVINFEQDLDNYFLDRAEHPEGVKEVRALMKHAENCAKKGVIWIGTANNPQEIDSAIIRAGRTDIKMAIGNLKNFAVSDTIKYLLYKYGEKERADSFNYSAITDFMNETNSVYTPAELELFVSKAIQHRMSEKQTLNEDMIISEMLEFNKNDYPSINPETEKKFETDKTYISDLEEKDKEAAEAKALALAKKTAAKQAEEEKTKVKNNNP